MTKVLLLDLILAAIRTELEGVTRGAKASFSAATDPDSKAENKYDTRTLEASYVARGQAQRVEELQEALHLFTGLSPLEWPTETAITIGAWVGLEQGAETFQYFVGPAAGGTEVVCEGVEILVITPASPLGQQLMGKREGAVVPVRAGGPTARVLWVK